MLKYLKHINKKWLIGIAVLVVIFLFFFRFFSLFSLFRNEPDCAMTFVDNRNFIFYRDGCICKYNMNLKGYHILYKLQRGETFDTNKVSFGCMKFMNKDEVFLNEDLILNLKTKKTRILKFYIRKAGGKWDTNNSAFVMDYFGDHCYIDATKEEGNSVLTRARILNYKTGKDEVIDLAKVIKKDSSIDSHLPIMWRVEETSDRNIVLFSVVNREPESTVIILYNLKEKKKVFEKKTDFLLYLLLFDKTNNRIIGFSCPDGIKTIDVESGKIKEIKTNYVYDAIGFPYIKNGKLITWCGGLKKDDPRWKTGVSSKYVLQPRYFQVRDLNDLTEKKNYPIPEDIMDYISYYDVDDKCENIIFSDTDHGCIFLYDLKNKKISMLTNSGAVVKLYRKYFD